MNWSAIVSNTLWTGSNLPAYMRFRSALNNPHAAQTQLLLRNVVHNADTIFGRQHHFGAIKSYTEFSERVPLADYNDLEPWIRQIMRGEQNVLTCEPVTRFVPTSGSTGARKLIPFTARLQHEFNSAIGPWIVDLYAQHPSVTPGCAYWSVTPAADYDPEDSTVPVGFAEDSSYLGGPRKKMVDAIMAAPGELQQVKDTEAFLYITLLCLLRRRDLRLISVWHPSFLGLLMDALTEHWEDLLRDIRTGDCKYKHNLTDQLRRALELRAHPQLEALLRTTDPRRPQTVWPLLKLISCWGDAHAEHFLPDLRARFPGISIQPKGLLATEAFVTIPFRGLHPLAICSHFFEFLGEDGRVYLSHELEHGNIYEVIVTTGGGLWRYRLRDSVAVKGFVGKTPSFRFVGRNGNVSDRFGEKLAEPFVASVIQKAASAAKANLCFALLAPTTNENKWYYTLFAEGEQGTGLAEQLEAALLRNPHYSWCRALGQLQAVRVQAVANGYAAFVAREIARGKRMGDIKPTALSLETDWGQHFENHSVRPQTREPFNTNSIPSATP